MAIVQLNAEDLLTLLCDHCADGYLHTPKPTTADDVRHRAQSLPRPWTITATADLCPPCAEVER